MIECGSLIAGPFCGQLLGDFGADVITRSKTPQPGDPMRGWRPIAPHGLSMAWPIIARTKKSVTCNLRDPRGQEIMRRLIGQADVLVENFRPGTLERWGLGYDELRRINPRLILVRVTGYGQSGPYADRAGFGSIGEAMGGVRYITGEPDRPPSRTGISLGDSLAGTFAALGTVLALFSRETSGRGQVVDSAIYEAVLALMESMLPEWHIAGQRRERTGAVLPAVAPSNVYPTADGSDILVAANRDTVFDRLCTVMDRPRPGRRPPLHHHRNCRHSPQVGIGRLMPTSALRVAHPPGVRAAGGEVPLEQIGKRRSRLVLLGQPVPALDSPCDQAVAAHRVRDRLLTHRPAVLRRSACSRGDPCNPRPFLNATARQAAVLFAHPGGAT